MSIVYELWRFIRVRKKYWLLPLIVVIFVIGGLTALTTGTAVAPLIYTLF
jgi:hypothetical protein